MEKDESKKLKAVLKTCGISKGTLKQLSTNAALHKLIERLFFANSSCFFKAFINYLARSGGTMDMVCPHLVEFAMLFITTRESPRDFAALLGLMEHLPNLALYDYVCGGLEALKEECEAAGVKLDERLGAVVLEDDIEAMGKFLPLSFPGLVSEVFPSFSSLDAKADTAGAPNLEVERPAHIETGSKHLFTCHDAFHNKPKVHKFCKARNPKFVLQFRTVNGSRSEQLNRLKKKVDPWLRGQSAQHNILLNLVLAHKRNRRINEAFLLAAQAQLETLNAQSNGISFRLVLSSTGKLKFGRV